MIYLSDKIYFDIITDNKLNQYITYYIDIQTSGFSDWNTIFVGRYFNTGDNRIYINDILTSQEWNDQVVTPDLMDDYITTLSSDNILYNVRFRAPEIYITRYIENVLSYYKDTNLPRGVELPSTGYNHTNILTLRTKYLPRVPKFSYTPSNFFFGVTFFQSDYMKEYRYIDWISSTQTGQGIVVFESMPKPTDSSIVNQIIDGEFYYYLTEPEPAKTLWLWDVAGDTDPFQVANIDDCPSKYYVIWQDRTGAYQCQPFSKRDYYNENISTTTIKNLHNQDKVINKQIESTWVLNSDWLTKEGYKAHETILTSPKIWLYDTELDMRWECICTDSQWQDKDRKLFNLQINLKSIETQNINY